MAGYDKVFFQRVSRGALPTARFVLPLIHQWIRPSSVADFGCGAGVWLQVWRELGILDVTGVESQPPLHPVPHAWKVGDLSQPLDLGRNVDLVQCLEVGEHLPAAAAATLVATLTRCAPVVLFSAALPGQGGWQHINERPPRYWRDLFEARGFALFDCLRHRLRKQASVRLSTAYNTFIYAHESAWHRLPQEVTSCRIAPWTPIPDTSPLWLKAARAFIRIWPVSWVTRVDRVLQLANQILPGSHPTKGESIRTYAGGGRPQPEWGGAAAQEKNAAQ